MAQQSHKPSETKYVVPLLQFWRWWRNFPYTIFRSNMLLLNKQSTHLQQLAAYYHLVGMKLQEMLILLFTLPVLRGTDLAAKRSTCVLGCGMNLHQIDATDAAVLENALLWDTLLHPAVHVAFCSCSYPVPLHACLVVSASSP